MRSTRRVSPATGHRQLLSLSALTSDASEVETPPEGAACLSLPHQEHRDGAQRSAAGVAPLSPDPGGRGLDSRVTSERSWDGSFRVGRGLKAPGLGSSARLWTAAGISTPAHGPPGTTSGSGVLLLLFLLDLSASGLLSSPPRPRPSPASGASWSRVALRLRCLCLCASPSFLPVPRRQPGAAPPHCRDCPGAEAGAPPDKSLCVGEVPAPCRDWKGREDRGSRGRRRLLGTERGRVCRVPGEVPGCRGRLGSCTCQGAVQSHRLTRPLSSVPISAESGLAVASTWLHVSNTWEASKLPDVQAGPQTPDSYNLTLWEGTWAWIGVFMPSAHSNVQPRGTSLSSMR